jgi:hypothetical protein
MQQTQHTKKQRKNENDLTDGEVVFWLIFSIIAVLLSTPQARSYFYDIYLVTQKNKMEYQLCFDLKTAGIDPGKLKCSVDATPAPSISDKGMERLGYSQYY